MKGLAVKLALVGLLATLGVAAWMNHLLPTGEGDAEALTFTPDRFRLVRGSGQRKGDHWYLPGDDARQTIVSIRLDRPLQAQGYRYLRLALDSSTPNENLPLFFWRPLGRSQVETLPLAPSPNHLVDLGASPRWRGRISELGLIFPPGSPPWRLGAVELSPADGTLAAIATLDGWLALELWSQHSVHFLDMDDPRAGPGLQEAVTLWVLAGLCLWFLLPGPRAPMPALILFLGLGWLLLDGRWLYALWRHAEISWNTFAPYEGADKYAAAIDKGNHRLAQALFQRLPADSPVDIYLPTPPTATSHYFYAKLPYLLAPHRVHRLTLNSRRGYLLVLEGTPVHYQPRQGRLVVSQIELHGVQRLMSTPAGTLYRFGEPGDAQTP